MGRRARETSEAELNAGTPPSPDARSADLAVLLVLVILATALVLRYVRLGDPPGLDELWSMELSTGRGSVQLHFQANTLFPAPAMTELEGAPPWHAVWTSLGRVTHPPLYFLALRGWRETWAAGEFAARCLSLVASLAFIALLCDAVRLTFRSRAAGLWAAALAAVAEPQVGHGSIVRGYALLLMFGTLAWWSVARIEAPAGDADATGTGRRGRPLAFHATLGAAVAAMLLTHYFAAGAVAALLGYVRIGMRGGVRRRATAAIAAGGLVWLAAWGPTLVHHARHFSGGDSTTDFLRRDTAGVTRLLHTLSDTLAAPLRLLVDLPQRTTPLAWIAGLACLGLLGFAAARRRRELLLPALWLAGTIGFVAALDLVRSTRLLHESRYLLLAAPAVYALIASPLTRLPAGHGGLAVRHALPCLVVLACLARVLASFGRPVAQLDWRPVAAFLDEPARAHDAVLFVREGQSDWFVGYQVMAYRHASERPPGRPIALLELRGADALVARLRERGRCWLINLSADPVRPGRLVPGFEARRADVPGFPPVVWELSPAPRHPPGIFDVSVPAS